MRLSVTEIVSLPVMWPWSRPNLFILSIYIRDEREKIVEGLRGGVLRKLGRRAGGLERR